MSSNTSLRYTTAPGVTARCSPTVNASGSTIDGIRGGAAISCRKRRNPLTIAQATGVDDRLPAQRADQRVVARCEPFHDDVEQESDSFSVAPIEFRVGEQAVDELGGGLVRLHRTLHQRIAMPCRVAESLVGLGRSAIRCARRDRGELAPERPHPFGDDARAARQIQAEPGPRCVWHCPARDAERRTGQ